MARKRPTASDVSPIPADHDSPQPGARGPDRADGLSHAEAHALVRCAPLTGTEFKAQRQLRAVYGGPKHFDIASRFGLAARATTGETRPGWLRHGTTHGR